jgi:hypothetical protein
MIHTFGDSHTYNLNQSDNVIQHHLGAILCYSFGRDKLERINIKHYNVNEGDTIIFSFGEIDNRCHVYKYINENKTYKDVINEIVINYFLAISENVKQYQHLNVWIYNVVPPPSITNTWIDTGYPFLGSDTERKNYVEYFNSKLKEYCKLYNYNFFDIYEKYIDEDRHLNKKYSDDHVHIKDTVFIKEYMMINKII